MKLTLGFSPCPNDTFIFDGMVHGKVDAEGLRFDVRLDDVEALNRSAFQKELDITKLSYHAFAYLSDHYELLDAGSALGKGCGPLLIARERLTPEFIKGARVAIPGHYTTAHFLFRLAFPDNDNKVNLVFSEIERAVAEGEVDAGVIIHENRFTYAKRGLKKCLDLGAFWEESTGYPIPLGGIAVRRSLPGQVKAKINRIMKASVRFALEQPESTYPYVRSHAQEMDLEVMRKHIGLYVNHYTEDLGQEGKEAVRHLFRLARERDLIPEFRQNIFLTENTNGT